MKRLAKHFNRRGFTLVETLLATFILVVISTMLINGFISTMGYSYQTSVYVKSGENNYTACMDYVATWNKLSKEDREKNGKQINDGNLDGVTKKTLTFTNLPTNAKLESLYVGVKDVNTLDNTIPVAVNGYEFSPDDNTYNAKVDNRKSIVYYPEYCWDGTNNSSIGKVRVMADYSGSQTKYYWVIQPSSGSYSSSTPKLSSTAIGS